MRYEWNDQNVQALEVLWAGGGSASLIAEAMGGGLSRNAIIGKAHRLGLAERRSGTVGLRSPHEDRHARPRMHGTARAATPPTPPFDDRTAINWRIPAPPVPPSLSLAHDDLTSGVCRFPDKGDALPYFFCGHPSLGNRPYCEAHCRIAYQPPKKRKPVYYAPETRVI